jgi:hypothetical protein
MRSYHERLRAPVLWWLLAAVNVLIIGSGIWAGLGGYWPAITYIALAALTGSFLVHWGMAVIEVTGGTLRAGQDTLPLDLVTTVVPLDEEQAAVLRGPRADPAAHLLLRPYLKRAVYVGVAAPPADGSAGDGPRPGGGHVPYWLIATRRPDELAAAIEAGAAHVRGDRAGQIME